MLFFTGEELMPLSIRGERDFLGTVYSVMGLVLLILGAVLHVPAGPRVVSAAPGPRLIDPGPPAPIEIKRTVMWPGPPETKPAGPGAASLEERLEAVNRRLASLKVRYGLDEISKETYKRLSAELDRQRAELELALYENR